VPLAVVAPLKEKRLPDSLPPRPEGYPWHPRATNSTAREVLCRSTPALCGSILALETNSLARTPRNPPEPSPSLGDLHFSARRGPPAGG
jgi:hypothetical protein